MWKMYMGKEIPARYMVDLLFKFQVMFSHSHHTEHSQPHDQVDKV